LKHNILPEYSLALIRDSLLFFKRSPDVR